MTVANTRPVTVATGVGNPDGSVTVGDTALWVPGLTATSGRSYRLLLAYGSVVPLDPPEVPVTHRAFRTTISSNAGGDFTINAPGGDFGFTPTGWVGQDASGSQAGIAHVNMNPNVMDSTRVTGRMFSGTGTPLPNYNRAFMVVVFA